MDCKRYVLIPIFIYMIIGFGLASGASFYSWNGKLTPGEKILVEGLTLMIDIDKNSGEMALIIQNETGIITILKDGQFINVNELTISFNKMNDYGLVTVSSNEFFSVVVPTPKQSDDLEKLKAENEKLKKEVQQLKDENTKLKQRVSELEKQAQSQPNTAELNARIVNLTKENRELKAELANLTNKYNTLKAKAGFLEQQNEEYRTMIQNLLKGTAQGSEQDYIEQAKKERLIGSVLLKSILSAGVIVGLIGYGLYRVKRRHEFAGL